jgi:hypothetical protein
MTSKTCARAWEAEAIEDGRLLGTDRASFERHAAVCDVCRREAEAFARLRYITSQVAPPSPTILHLRRMRAALLDRAEANWVHRRTGARNGWLFAAAAIAVVAACLAIGESFRVRRFSTSTAIATMGAGPVFEVVKMGGAVVMTHSEGGVARAVLSEGVAAFHVEHLARRERFVLALPDGELEVWGTRFVAEVQAGHTQSVSVTEGIVVLRIGAEPERILRAAERWLRAPPAAVSEPAVTASPVAASSLPPPASQPLAVPKGPRGQAVAVGPASDVPSARRAAANERFARAVAALEGGRNAEAESLFSAFLRDSQRDTRSEDAAFLRAVARSRAGDAAEAASLARAYLRSYPQGLRRKEAEAIAGDSAEAGGR